ncbi:TauD/TfdA family dioxygenase [Paraburkholderia dipogonis]|uniref:TauD/TfdA family dioxygenase n=1 Tax=Paraburkholderia dipogonis TaxID=1211383 RepID=UPI0035E5AD35
MVAESGRTRYPARRHECARLRHRRNQVFKEGAVSLNFTRLTPALGVLVEGIDLARPIDNDVRDRIREALTRHQVLFFRNQTISVLQQRDFTAQFGDLHTHPIYPQHPEAREIMVLDADTLDLKDNAIWHTDVTFTATPPLGAVLVARQLPETGGDTLWASSFAAYDALSDRLKTFLEGLTATARFHQELSAQAFRPDRTGPAALE